MDLYLEVHESPRLKSFRMRRYLDLEGDDSPLENVFWLGVYVGNLPTILLTTTKFFDLVPSLAPFSTAFLFGILVS